MIWTKEEIKGFGIRTLELILNIIDVKDYKKEVTIANTKKAIVDEIRRRKIEGIAY